MEVTRTMKRVGVITIPDYNNYGNRLQNYAVKQTFEKMGYRVDTLELNDPLFKKYRARKCKLLVRKYGLTSLIRAAKYLRGKKSEVKREKLFETFTKKYLNVRYEPSYSKKLIDQMNKEYDYFVIGSDQIWHPIVNETPTLFFGTFTSPEKRLFFAPSFGISELSGEYAKVVAEGLKNAKYLSVREQAGANIIQKLLHRDAKVLIDPTMMLDGSEWKKLAKDPDGLPKNKYVLGCFLGKLSENYLKYMEELGTENSFSNYILAQKGYPEGYATGPSEFLASIMKSEVVLTDSFHCVVFAILFGKPFVVFPRIYDNGSNSGSKLDGRMQTLLNRFQLENRIYGSVEKDALFSCNYSNAKDILEKERNVVYDFFGLGD